MEKTAGINNGYILTICLNPVLQKTICMPHLWENEVNRSNEYYLDASGKGINVSRVLTQLGEKVIHLTHAGGMNKKLFLKICRDENIRITAVDSDSEIRYCYTLLNRERNTTTEIVEEGVPVKKDTETKIYNAFLELQSGASGIIISGTKAPGYSDYLISELVKIAKAGNKTVVLDIKNEDLKNSLCYCPDIIKPNFSEFIGTFFSKEGLKENMNGDAFVEIVKHKITDIYKTYGIYTILTRGKNSTLCFDGNEFFTIQTHPVETIVNTTGCGDAFTAGFTAGYLKEQDFLKAIKIGHSCSAKNARSLKPGHIL